MTALSIQMAHDQDRTTLALIGDLDMTSAVHLDDAVEAALYDGHRHLTVDASELAFCDSSGLWALLRAQRALAQVQGTMTLTGVHGVLRRVLEVTRLADAFTIQHTPPPAACRVPHRAPLRTRSA
ncbi:STAS domain-containing protein [Sphaerisporangium sp. NPDC005288]|uniref:STAS domain-containing protein n=1 Tax=Sphaerisporangium sp. NPDC005288 TaxID=3155114 RepID=UPI0033AA1C42